MSRRGAVHTSSTGVIDAAPVAKASSLLQTTFGLYHRAEDGRLKLRANGAYTLPPRVAAHVDTIFGLYGVALPKAALTKPNPTPSKPVDVTPTVLAQTYHVGTPYVNRSGKNKQAVAEFQGQYMNATDLATFFKEYVPAAVAGDVTLGVTAWGEPEEASLPAEDGLADRYTYRDPTTVPTAFAVTPGGCGARAGCALRVSGRGFVPTPTLACTFLPWGSSGGVNGSNASALNGSALSTPASARTPGTPIGL